MKFIVILIMALITIPASARDFYKWVDENGVIRYSDREPPQNAKDVQKLNVRVQSLDADDPSLLPPQTRAAAEKLPVTLYSFKECGEACKLAEGFLNKRGVPYRLKNDIDAKIELKKLTGKLEVPTMLIGNTSPIIGFQEELWNQQLDLAGYAKAKANAKSGTSMAIKPKPIPVDETAEKPEVTLYSFDECGEVCTQAEEFLNKRGVPYTRKGSNNDKIELQKLTGKLDAPVMVIGNTKPISGFQEARWNKELDIAGYARNNSNSKPGSGAEAKSPSKPPAAGTAP
jgi:glutaredoxin